MDFLIGDILITTYVSPHLFWVIESTNERHEKLINIKKELKKFLQNPTKDNISEVGQVSEWV